MSDIILQNEDEFSKSLDNAILNFLENLKLKTDESFKNELNFCHEYFHKLNNITVGVNEIKKRIDEIFDIVNSKRIMLYKQEGYSYLRPFEDSYQDAIDFLNSENGERVKQVFYYFGYKYKVPEDPARADL